MPKTLLPLLALVAALSAALLAPSAAPAATVNVAVGIGDQGREMFDNPNFQRLKIKKVRYFIRWNAIDDPYQMQQAQAWVDKAHASGAKVLMHISSDVLVRPADARRLGIQPARLPSVREYRQKVGALVHHFGGRRLEWGVWNEANHDTQPTYRNPARAAQFFLEMRKMCSGCTIVALDVLDQRGVDRYIQRYFRALGSRRSLARIVGIHNYSDTNRYRQRGRPRGQMTRVIIRSTKRYNRRAQFWLTETGGVIKFASFKCDPRNPRPAEQRQARAMTDMFRLARTFRRDVKRLYSYNWQGTACGPNDRFDAGLVRANGTPRPAYSIVRNNLRNFRR